MKYEEIFDSLKKKYKQVHDILDKEPMYYKISMMTVIAMAIIFTVWSILQSICTVDFISKYNKRVTLVMTGMYMISFLYFIFSSYLARKNIKKISEDSKLLHEMTLEDEAKRYKVEPPILALYLIYNFKPSKLYKCIHNSFCIISAIVSLLYLPAWNNNDGKLVFVFVVIANVIISVIFGIFDNKIYNTDRQNLYYYVINPFKDDFKKNRQRINANIFCQ